MKEETEFILQCNLNSFIEQVMYSRENLDTSVLLNKPLLFCLAPESIESGKTFFDTIRLLGKAENYELALLLGDQKHHFSLSGVLLRNHIIIMAQHAPETDSAEVAQITEAMISEEVEASLEIPETFVQDSESEIAQREVTVWDLLEEMSRLNNELINTKRELIRKNMELVRLKEQLKKR